MKEGEKAYRLEAIEAKPTKDVLSVKYIYRENLQNVISYLFKVKNLTAGREYFVTIMKNSVDDYVVVCTCPARTSCKHQLKAKDLFEQIKEGLEKV